uniref:Selenide, water dikinase n=1 Tax=Rhabditophanes sp. KR3021 TaxID=114890 RepID=A0AC35TW60_9BILA
MKTTLDIIERLEKGLFNPESIGLPTDFLLTKLTEAKGCGCKVERSVLLELLKDFNTEEKDECEVGIGLDSCVIPLRHKGLFLVTTTDFFYPLVDDPYIQGRITCANVLSDLYAAGVTETDNMLMLLGVYKDFLPNERDIVVKEFMKGFKDCADLADTKIRGGQTVKCPWLLLGGVATSVCTKEEMLDVTRANEGNVLVLTKPLGGQIAVNAFEWLKINKQRVEDLKIEDVDRKIVEAYNQVCEQMCRLNRNAAILAKKYGAFASTDVTGFGILGHADNLVKSQKAKNLKFVLNNLPTLNHVQEISKNMPGNNGFRLFTGTSAETSGGLLLAMEEGKAKDFIAELKEMDGFPAWIIGKVEKQTDSSDNYAIIPNDCNFFIGEM